LPPNVFGCWNKGLIEHFEDERENLRSNSNTLTIKYRAYELEVQFLAKFSDSAFGG
jgi:hypothetical protein